MSRPRHSCRGAGDLVLNIERGCEGCRELYARADELAGGDLYRMHPSARGHYIRLALDMGAPAVEVSP